MNAHGTAYARIDAIAAKIKHLSFPGTCVTARASVTRIRVGGRCFLLQGTIGRHGMQSDGKLPGAGNLNYLDFELEIGPGSGREYPVSVIRSPGGEARETMRFPFDKLALESRLQKLQIALLRSGGTRRRAPSPEEQSVQDFGGSLFNALLTGEARNRMT